MKSKEFENETHLFNAGQNQKAGSCCARLWSCKGLSKYELDIHQLYWILNWIGNKTIFRLNVSLYMGSCLQDLMNITVLAIMQAAFSDFFGVIHATHKYRLYAVWCRIGSYMPRSVLGTGWKHLNLVFSKRWIWKLNRKVTLPQFLCRGLEKNVFGKASLTCWKIGTILISTLLRWLVNFWEK